MKDISTLVDDIYDLFEKEKFNPTEEQVLDFGTKLAKHLSDRIAEERTGNDLRISLLGTQCERKLWYMINHPEWAEKLSAETRIKFLYGDLLESLLLFLAEQAGHSVEGQQDTVELFGVKGHRDAIIDGRLVDVKSASTQGFKKFKDNAVEGAADAFGYQDQLNGYYQASKEDPALVDRENISFLAIDKQFGHIVLDTYKPNNVDYGEKIARLRNIVGLSDPPPRSFGSEPDGRSGNEKLGTYCSYCAFKHICWPNLRTFVYARGPVYLTHVERTPDVQEV